MKRLLILALAGSGAVANAQVLYSSNFDALSLGNLATQDGWVTGSGTTNLPQVTNNNSFSPSNSVLLSAPGTGATFNSVSHTFAASIPSNQDTYILKMSAKIWVNSISGADRYFGITFGTNTTATTGNVGIALGGNGLRGGAGSYASFNGLAGGLLQARTTADFTGRWVEVSMIADRSQTTNNVTFSFANLGTSGGLATESFVKSVNFGTTNLTHIQMVSDWGTTSTFTGSALIDDVSFAAVPEPASLAVLGLGVVALMRRRKKA